MVYCYNITEAGFNSFNCNKLHKFKLGGLAQGKLELKFG